MKCLIGAISETLAGETLLTLSFLSSDCSQHPVAVKLSVDTSADYTRHI